MTCRKVVGTGVLLMMLYVCLVSTHANNDATVKVKFLSHQCLSTKNSMCSIFIGGWVYMKVEFLSHQYYKCSGVFIIRDGTETRWPPHWIYYPFNAYKFARMYS